VNRPIDRAGLPSTPAETRLKLDQVEGRQLVEALFADVRKNMIPDVGSTVANPLRRDNTRVLAPNGRALGVSLLGGSVPAVEEGLHGDEPLQLRG
jgi:hypothetical protein